MAERVTAAVLFTLVLAAAPVVAQDLPWTIVLKGNLTTSSQIYPDPIENAPYVDVTDFFGYGAELKYLIPETHLAVSISVDRIHARFEQPLFKYQGPYIPVNDGFDAVPVEVTGYFIIPASGNTFGIFMGGGLGMYFGQRTYSWGTTEADLVNSTPGIGIHVLAGVSYRFVQQFSVIGEMKFRDLQFKATNKFPVAVVDYEGTRLRLPSGPIDSNIHTDGITFQIGVAFNF
jgi:hypothetical protein